MNDRDPVRRSDKICTFNTNVWKITDAYEQGSNRRLKFTCGSRAVAGDEMGRRQHVPLRVARQDRRRRLLGFEQFSGFGRLDDRVHFRHHLFHRDIAVAV